MTQLNTVKLSDRASVSVKSPSAESFVGKYGAWALPLLVLLSLPFFSSNPFHVHLAVLVCLNIIVVNGLSFLSRTGQLSFCHAAFMGMGAYASVIATTRLEMPFLASVTLGMLSAAVIAFLLGAVILRLKGVYFVLVTFCFGELFRLFLLEGGDVTGGANGIANIPPVELFGFVFDTKLSFYCLAATVALASVWFLVTFFHTPAGTALDAVGDNPELAEASGLSVQRTQMFAFVLGSAMAGVGGALLGHYLGFVSPESFNQHVSVAVIIMLVMGGRSSVAGPIVGALIMTPLPELFRSAIETQNILYGITLILVLRFLPRGLVSIRINLGKNRGNKA
jgi:branched-chain amino acid transport system permease protein